MWTTCACGHDIEKHGDECWVEGCDCRCFDAGDEDD